MGGVDLAEQIKQSFSIIRKSNKALKKLFYHGLEVCLLNSFTILKKVKQTPQDFLAENSIWWKENVFLVNLADRQPGLLLI